MAATGPEIARVAGEGMSMGDLMQRLREGAAHAAEEAPAEPYGWEDDGIEAVDERAVRAAPIIQKRVLESHRDLLEKARSERGARDKLYSLVSTLMAECCPTSRHLAGTAEDVVRRIAGDLLGYGPITELLGDDRITEIMVNGPEEIWVELSGELRHTRHRFRDANHLYDVLERIFAPSGRRIDLAHPWADGRLPDGSRAHAILPPLAVSGPYLTIRKFNHEMFDLEELVTRDTLSKRAAEYLQNAVRRGRNILISGAAGTGKTTLLNALSAHIPQSERVVSIEDAAELKLQHPHWLHLESRLPNPDGSGEITMRELLRNALRMRPDRILIGEVRGREAFELLSALTTGHAGALATVHAAGPGHALRRVVHLVQMAETGIPYEVIHEQVCDVMDLVVHLRRSAEGRRWVESVSAVAVGEQPVSPVRAALAGESGGEDG